MHLYEIIISEIGFEQLAVLNLRVRLFSELRFFKQRKPVAVLLVGSWFCTLVQSQPSFVQVQSVLPNRQLLELEVSSYCMDIDVHGFM